LDGSKAASSHPYLFTARYVIQTYQALAGDNDACTLYGVTGSRI
jgi:hypothetical protein